MRTISLKSSEELIQHYHNNGGQHTTIKEGVLGLGKVVCYGEGLKTTIITEYFINPWASGHKVRMYNTTPKKYKQYINN